MSQADLSSTVDDLLDSLDDVEDALEPLLSKSLQESLASVPGPVERAKLLFWLAYTLHSCVWAYTKTAAEDPEQHGVLDELKRIQGYNRKLLAAANKAKKAEVDQPDGVDAAESSTSTRRLPIDKDAASRFITAAIANQPKAPAADSKFYTAESSVQDPLAGPGPHSRLSSLARASVRNPDNGKNAETGSSAANSVQADDSSSDDEDLQVFVDGEPSESRDGTDADVSRLTDLANGQSSSGSASKKRKKSAKSERAQDGSDKSKHIRYDPLQGYGAQPTAKAHAKSKSSVSPSTGTITGAGELSAKSASEAVSSGKDATGKKQKRRRKGAKSGTSSPQS